MAQNKALDLRAKADESMRIAETYSVDKNFLFLTTFRRYQFQIGALEQLEDTLNEDKLLVTKEYVKGRKNLYAHPALAEYAKMSTAADRTVATLIKIVNSFTEGEEDDGEDPLMAALRGETGTLRADLERLRAEQRAMEIRLAIMKGAAELVGKEPGADPDNLTSREKTTLIKDISETLGVNAESLLKEVGIARSTYYYQLKAMRRPDKNANLLSLVREAFGNSRRRYGYKRIHLELKSAGIIVSAKRIMRLMTSHGMVPVLKSAKRYSSYKGEIGGAPANLVNRDFHATAPNRLWVTDITEFSIPAGKVYLSPVIDCHDGMPVAWTIGTSPNAALANGMLRDACATLKPGETPIIHSDRGCHYRWPEWIRICTEHGLTRSMSAKGCSPDNAAAEGFFGRLKQEFFHKRSFRGVTIDEFTAMLDEYMVWYRDKRIKTEYGMSIMDKRIQLGLVA